MGLIVALAICGAVGYAGLKIIPARIDAYEFRDTLREECRLAAVRNSDAAVRKRIMEKAEDLEIPLKKKRLEIKRTRSEMVIRAAYELPIDLMVTTYTYKFTAEERAPIF